MRLNRGAGIDVSQVTDRRGLIGRLAAGPSSWGLGLILSIAGRRGGLPGVLAVLALLFVGSLGVHAITNRGDNRTMRKECSSANATDQLDCRNVLYINSIQEYWSATLPTVFTVMYTESNTVFFSGRTNTGCGDADSGTGPFYCSADKLVYLDLSFYKELANQLGAPGEFAQPYVLAHEYGHHVQDLVGTEAAMRRAQQRNRDDTNKLARSSR
jgi:predicted metalloprotease